MGYISVGLTFPIPPQTPSDTKIRRGSTILPSRFAIITQKGGCMLDKYAKGLLAIVLTVIVGNAGYRFFIDVIVCPGSQDLQDVRCKAYKAKMDAELRRGGNPAEDPEARHDCWCAART